MLVTSDSGCERCRERTNYCRLVRLYVTITMGHGTGMELVRSFSDAETEGGALSSTNKTPNPIHADAWSNEGCEEKDKALRGLGGGVQQGRS